MTTYIRSSYGKPSAVVRNPDGSTRWATDEEAAKFESLFENTLNNSFTEAPSDGDGIALTSTAHPRLAWWKRPYSWLVCWWAARRLGRSLETIEIEVPRPSPLEQAAIAVRRATDANGKFIILCANAISWKSARNAWLEAHDRAMRNRFAESQAETVANLRNLELISRLYRLHLERRMTMTPDELDAEALRNAAIDKLFGFEHAESGL